MIARRIAAAATALALCGTQWVAAMPAAAHGNDPTLVPVVRTVEPALPPEVVVQVRTTVSEQMLVANPTATPLYVLDPDGGAFLRVSAAGAEGNVANPFFHRTLNPAGVPARTPDFARSDAKPRWVDLASTPNWGWFEPRLHPFAPGAEPAGDQPGLWQVGMRYGDQPVRVDGALERRAVTGVFAAALLPRSGDVTVSVVQGLVPALLLVAPPNRRVEVEGRDGRPFLRLDSGGAFASRDSAAFDDNPDFAAAATAGSWVRVGEPGRVRWLDPRLRYRADRPPAVVERAKGPTEVDRWEIPIRIDGASDPLRGTITWIPAGTIAASPSGGNSLAPWALGGVGVAVVGAVSLAVGRARGRPASE